MGNKANSNLCHLLILIFKSNSVNDTYVLKERKGNKTQRGRETRIYIYLQLNKVWESDALCQDFNMSLTYFYQVGFISQSNNLKKQSLLTKMCLVLNLIKNGSQILEKRMFFLKISDKRRTDGQQAIRSEKNQLIFQLMSLNGLFSL